MYNTKFRERVKIKKTVNSFQDVLKDSQRLQNAAGDSTTFWRILEAFFEDLECFGMFQKALEYSGKFQKVLKRSEKFGNVAKGSRPFWLVVEAS